MMLFNDLRKLGGAGKQDAGKPLNVEWFFSTNLFFFSIIGPIHFTFHCWCYYYFYEIARRPTAHYIQRENTSWFVWWHKNGISSECNLEPVASKFFLKLVSSITSLYNPWPITPAPCCLLPPKVYAIVSRSGLFNNCAFFFKNFPKRWNGVRFVDSLLKSHLNFNFIALWKGKQTMFTYTRM